MARPRKFERTALLEAALGVFWERGYEATTVQELGERMGIHPGSLFGTFGDKRALFYEALQLYEERVRSYLFALLESPVPRREALGLVFAATIDFLLQNREAGHRGCFMVNSLMERCTLDPDMDTRAQVNLKRLEEVFYKAVVTAAENGEISARPEGELRAIARSLMANLIALRVLGRVGASREVLNDTARLALTVLDSSPPPT